MAHAQKCSPAESGSAFHIAEEIFSRAKADRIAVIEGETEWSYGDLCQRSSDVAAKLRAEFDGIRVPRVGLRCPDGSGYIALAMGILRAGGVFVPIAPELTAGEREHLGATIALDFLLTSDGGREGEIAFQMERKHVAEPPVWAETLATINPAFIRFSSGTTGRSKGIVLSHESLRARVEAANAGLQIGPDDRILWVLAMSHHFAVSIILYLWHGATIVLPASHLASDILSSATRHRATVIYAAPFHYELLAGDGGKTRWPSLRLAVSTTARLTPEVGTAFDKAFGIYPSQALGIIEVGLPFLNIPDPRTSPDSVGSVQPSFAFELRDPEGNMVQPGGQGELFLKGPGLFDAYIEPWQERSNALVDGWFSTGDIARADVRGRIEMIGRNRSAISFGGMKFFPEEVEEVLCRHPSIAEARVYGSPHPTFGTVPSAEIVTAPGEPPLTAREILSFCKSRIARYKIPLEITFVDRIARTASGKIKRQ